MSKSGRYCNESSISALNLVCYKDGIANLGRVILNCTNISCSGWYLAV